MNMPFWLRLAIEKRPALYMRMLRIKNKGRKFERFIVSDETDLVIEGFPRCANSFATQSIRLLTREQGRDFRFATHAHSSAHVVAGLRIGKPTLVVIREPKSAIISLQALWRQSGISIQSVNGLLKRYIQFYEMLMPYRTDIVVSDFKRTTAEYPGVIRELNERFDLGLPEVETQEELEALVIPASPEHLSPSKDRDTVKREIRENFEKRVDPKLLDHGYLAYRNFLG